MKAWKKYVIAAVLIIGLAIGGAELLLQFLDLEGLAILVGIMAALFIIVLIVYAIMIIRVLKEDKR
jgi:hypothetical protein